MEGVVDVRSGRGPGRRGDTRRSDPRETSKPGQCSRKASSGRSLGLVGPVKPGPAEGSASRADERARPGVHEGAPRMRSCAPAKRSCPYTNGHMLTNNRRAPPGGAPQRAWAFRNVFFKAHARAVRCGVRTPGPRETERTATERPPCSQNSRSTPRPCCAPSNAPGTWPKRCASQGWCSRRPLANAPRSACPEEPCLPRALAQPGRHPTVRARDVAAQGRREQPSVSPRPEGPHTLQRAARPLARRPLPSSNRAPRERQPRGPFHPAVTRNGGPHTRSNPPPGSCSRAHARPCRRGGVTG